MPWPAPWSWASQYSQTRWDESLEPYGGLAAHEIVMQRDHARRLWAFLLRQLSGKAAPIPEVLVVSDEGDRRALSVALAVADGLPLPRASIYLASDPDRKLGKDYRPPNDHVFQTAKSMRYAVPA
jgi:hypothetical protein